MWLLLLLLLVLFVRMRELIKVNRVLPSLFREPFCDCSAKKTRQRNLDNSSRVTNSRVFGKLNVAPLHCKDSDIGITDYDYRVLEPERLLIDRSNLVPNKTNRSKLFVYGC